MGKNSLKLKQRLNMKRKKNSKWIVATSSDEHLQHVLQQLSGFLLATGSPLTMKTMENATELTQLHPIHPKHSKLVPVGIRGQVDAWSARYPASWQHLATYWTRPTTWSQHGDGGPHQLAGISSLDLLPSCLGQLLTEQSACWSGCTFYQQRWVTVLSPSLFQQASCWSEQSKCRWHQWTGFLNTGIFRP